MRNKSVRAELVTNLRVCIWNHLTVRGRSTAKLYLLFLVDHPAGLAYMITQFYQDNDIEIEVILSLLWRKNVVDTIQDTIQSNWNILLNTLEKRQINNMNENSKHGIENSLRLHLKSSLHFLFCLIRITFTLTSLDFLCFGK